MNFKRTKFVSTELKPEKQEVFEGPTADEDGRLYYDERILDSSFASVFRDKIQNLGDNRESQHLSRQ